ncbi:Glucose uptake protein GlcU [Pontiella desulfatans]|uniref:Glucose uptake protein GlcU n=1 Tax=Pontiella desulfatans TaxID=2750659 RepID=A0A6C2U1X8_PONDE|nr:GRP family sugar transporter [Pontiella desulfatans]VGO13978.1 Glucose uptake protein GlcU [Pontiella desulfatans]
MGGLGFVYAVVCVLAWGSWLVPSEKVKFPNEQAKTFYVALATSIIATIVVALRGEMGQLASGIAWVPVIGGLIWAVSAYCAFVGCNHIGIAKAFGIWAPLNIMVSFIWSLTLFGQFRDCSVLTWGVGLVSLIVMIGGIFMIIFAGGAGEKEEGKSAVKGLLGAVGAGILWGTFYIPAAYVSETSSELAQISPWASALPLAVGMLIGTSIMVALTRTSPKLENTLSTVRAMSSGGLWCAGFFGMLLMVAAIGPGPGYTLASLCVAVNALWGVFYFKDPAPKTKAGNLTLTGVLIATLAGTVLGNFGSLDRIMGQEKPAVEEVQHVNE